MGLRIRTNVASQEAQKNLRAASQVSQDEFAKLSSGKRITKSADDAAGMAIAKKLEAHTRGFRQAIRNSNDGISLVQTVEGGLNEVSNILTRLRELSVQAASDTIGDNERLFLDNEYQQLISEVDRISNSTSFNGIDLLNGESNRGVMDIQVGINAGEFNTIQFDSEITNTTAGALGIDGLSVNEKASAQGSFEAIDGAINTVSGLRANLGAVQSRLNSSVSNLETQAVTQDQARSVIEDVDVADSTAKIASNEILKTAGIATLAQVNSIPTSALRLIG